MLFSPHEPSNVPERFVTLIPKVCTRAAVRTFNGVGVGSGTMHSAYADVIAAINAKAAATLPTLNSLIYGS